MTAITLHVGQHKTGSTAIQACLSARTDILQAAGVLYPGLAVAPHHHAILCGAIWDRRIRYLFERCGFSDDRVRDLSRAEWSRLAQLVRGTGPDRIILSAETFFLPMSAPERDRLIAALATLGRVDRVVAYLRDPVSYALSAFQEQLKSRPGAVFGHLPETTAILDGYAQAFGPAALDLRVFDRDRFRGGSVVADFIAGQHLDELDLGPPPAQPNATLSAEAMAILQAHGPKGGGPEGVARQRDFRAAVIRADRAVAGATRPRLRTEARDSIAARATDAARLRDRFGIVFDALDYDRIGGPAPLDLGHARPVADLCMIDTDRLERLHGDVSARLGTVLPGRMGQVGPRRTGAARVCVSERR